MLTPEGEWFLIMKWRWVFWLDIRSPLIPLAGRVGVPLGSNASVLPSHGLHCHHSGSGLVTAWRWWKSWLSTRPPLKPPQWGKEGCLVIDRCGGSPGFPSGLHWHCSGDMVSLPPSSDASPSSSRGFLWHHLSRRIGVAHSSLVRVEV